MKNSETLFRSIFLAVLIANMSIAIYHRLQAAKSTEKISRVEEGKVILPLRVLGALVLWISILTFAIFPKAMAWSTFSMPTTLRWFGAAIALLSVPALYWVLHNLGKNFTDTVATRKTATLVTSGPYRWVRHPFYTVTFGGILALSLMTANWFLGLLALLMLSVIIKRTGKEEAKLIERFGDAYRQYMQRTGRFLPKFAAHR